MSSLYLTASVIERLDFSACGTQIIIRLCGLNHSIFHSISSDPIYQLALEQVETQLQETPSNGGSKRKGRRNTSDTDELALKPRRSAASFELAQPVTNISLSPKAVMSRSATSQWEVQVTQQYQGVKEVQPILSLPNWAGIDSIGVAVRDPTSREEKSSIILNKAAKS